MKCFSDEDLKDPYYARLQALMDSVPTEVVPSLHPFIGRELIDMTQYSGFKPSRYLDLDNVMENQVFAWSQGYFAFDAGDNHRMILEFNDEVVSVCVEFCETFAELDRLTKYTRISVHDSRYTEPKWRQFVGKTIAGFSMIRTKEDHGYGRPNEHALGVHFADGTMFAYGSEIFAKPLYQGMATEDGLADRDTLVIRRLV